MSTNAAALPTSPTPILDRQAPLPPLAAPGSDGRLLNWIGLIILFVVTFAFCLASYVPSKRQEIQLIPDSQFVARFASLGLMALLVAFAAVAVHEAGHTLGGLCAGFRFNALRIGPLMIHRGFRISLYLGPGWWLGGAAQMSPVANDRRAAAALVLVFAGPAASIVSGCAVVLLSSRGSAAWLFGIVSVVGGLADLVPFRTGLTVSDEARIWMLLRQRRQGERWLALLRLGADLADGVPPESLPADDLAKAVALCDHSADTVMAHAIAYSSAFHQHQDSEAGHLLETCLRLSDVIAPDMRAALISDAAVFQGRRRKRPDLAGQWMASIPGAAHLSWLRRRAEAAALEARGDIDGCLRMLDEYETAIRALPNTTQREMLLRGRSRWRSELSRATTPHDERSQSNYEQGGAGDDRQLVPATPG